MSEFAKGCIALIVTDAVLVAVGLWIFDSQAGRSAVAAACIGYTVGMVAFKLWPTRPPGKPKGQSQR